MRVTARSLGNASPHWIYTWLDEYFSDFPLGGQPADSSTALRSVIAEARGFLAPADRDEFDLRIQRDARVRTVHDDAFLAIYPDGWTSEESVLRVRAVKTSWRRVRLHCRHASPRGGSLVVRISGPRGQAAEKRVSEPGEFILELELGSSYRSPAYWSFTLKTEGSFVPADVEANSSDNRLLAFLIEGIELQE